ncbi:alpha-1,2-fucosyltransferase [Bradyrhizobium sp. SRL28]|uniref:alpha-1,2-fucosyltransferase n=1 Tax=Bradyrhizobium sp. SRL28 TaxID=2836178 RepID=UPI001BDE796D|nr:alpha-1,2-fucosyltransferase [Bradyrhizobium sp. SRL28]MBT1515635.1 alpha-1,2-fucosyltransferase [Bradyrhizobium sp. SRL28]
MSVGSNLTRADYLSGMMNRYRPPTIELDGVVLRVGNYGDIERYREMFPLRKDDGTQIAKDRLLIHVRAGDVGVPSHGSYGPIPISYYQYLVSKTKLTPVFIGETSPSPYIEALTSEFPGAEFVGGASAFEDFQTIRRAHHIAISVSSFSWLAAFLSRAETIHVPLAGLLDPRERPDADLLPLGDPRYRFHDVSARAWKDRYSDVFANHADFRPLSVTEAKRLKGEAVRRTVVQNARIHFGLMRRMIFNRKFHRLPGDSGQREQT